MKLDSEEKLNKQKKKVLIAAGAVFVAAFFIFKYVYIVDQGEKAVVTNLS